ncbi:MAG TPA: GTPase [Ktedonobacterales bacterium]|nr:GTPase [Ktedonobacterales bacterium]
MTELHIPNIVVMGRSGVGKSSLINAVFGRKVAATGSGDPITQHYERYADDHVVLFDTPGWVHGEAGDQSFYHDTQAFLSRYRTITPTDHIHLIWYTIDAPGARFTDFDAKLIGGLLGNYPVFVVLTKCDIAREQEIQSVAQVVRDARLANVVQVLRVAAQPMTGAPPFGVSELVDSTFEQLPLFERQTFELVSAVREALNQAMVARGKQARNHILVAAGESAAAGAIPIPFLDIPILLAISQGMMYKIGGAYSLTRPEIDGMIAEKQIKRWIYSAVIGRSAIFELVKFIPGVGTLTGGAIDAVTCAAVTGAIGYTFQHIFREITWRRWREAGFKVDDVWVQQQLDKTFQRVWNDLRHAKREDLERYEA